LHVGQAIPHIRLSDTDATTNTEVLAFLEFYRGLNDELVGLVGYPSATSADLGIRNYITGGDVVVRVNGAEERIRALAAGGVGVTGPLTVDGEQIAAILDTMASLRLSAVTAGKSINLQGHTAAGDGGGGVFIGVTSVPGTYTDNGGTIIVPTGGDGSAAWLLQSGNIYWKLLINGNGQSMRKNILAMDGGSPRKELEIYADSSGAYSTGSRGAGFHLYGNDDTQHDGIIAMLTGPDDNGDAR
jgi:hypothetical protein